MFSFFKTFTVFFILFVLARSNPLDKDFAKIEETNVHISLELFYFRSLSLVLQLLEDILGQTRLKILSAILW